MFAFRRFLAELPFRFLRFFSFCLSIFLHLFFFFTRDEIAKSDYRIEEKRIRYRARWGWLAEGRRMNLGGGISPSEKGKVTGNSRYRWREVNRDGGREGNIGD